MSMSSPILLLHVCAAIVALLSGAMAVFFRKGSGWHAVAGNVFFVSMVCMTTSAAYMAAFLSPNRANLQVAVFTLYLVTTARVAARRKGDKPGMFDRVALLVVLADGVAGVTWGFMAASSGTRTLDRTPAAAYFIFGVVALLCASTDIRMILRGGVFGARRIARHLWRMGLALLIVLLSLPKVFPESMRGPKLLITPPLLLLGFMIFSLWRVSKAYRAKRAAAPVILRSEGGEASRAA